MCTYSSLLQGKGHRKVIEYQDPWGHNLNGPCLLLGDGNPEMKLLDVRLTKDLSLFLLSIHSPFYWRI
jgi:hypothetical protein